MSMSFSERGLCGVRVLVVDDNAMNLEVARCILEIQGATVWTAGNGHEAVDHLMVQPQGFDVVLMDMQMPVLDGNEATGRIRNGLGLTRLPIIALTAEPAAQEVAAASGMNDFLSKPLDAQAVARCIRRHVQVGGGAATESAPEHSRAVVPGFPEIEGIDSRDACLRLGGDLGLFRSMLKRLLNDFSDLGREPATEPDALARLAARLHDLKGSAGTLGAKAIEGHSAEAEAACRAGQTDRIEHMLRHLADQLDRLRQNSAAELRRPIEPAQGEEVEQALNLHPAELDELLHLLRQFNLGAKDRFAALSPQLRQLLGNDSYTLAREQIDDLKFGDATKLLDEMSRQQGLTPHDRLPTQGVGAVVSREILP